MEQDEQSVLPLPPTAARKHHPPPPHLKCPRCDSNNTKFCYYNNYSLAQPRYFCKACRRYWTHGGTLRNVPVGGGCRKNKRPAKASPSSSNLLSPSLRPQNPTDHPSGPPPALGNSLYVVGGGGFTTPFTAMPPAAGGVAQVNLGGGRGQFGGNLSLFQAVSFQSLKSQATNQFQHPPTNIFQAHQNSINPPITPWGNQIPKTAGISPSPAVSSLWRGGVDRLESSLGASNQWSTENYPGFNPCHR